MTATHHTPGNIPWHLLQLHGRLPDSTSGISNTTTANFGFGLNHELKSPTDEMSFYIQRAILLFLDTHLILPNSRFKKCTPDMLMWKRYDTDSLLTAFSLAAMIYEQMEHLPSDAHFVLSVDEKGITVENSTTNSVVTWYPTT